MTASTIHIIKTANETRADYTAGYADDAELTLALAANTPYFVEIGLQYFTYNVYASTLYAQPVYTGTMDTSALHSTIQDKAWVYPLTAYDTAPGSARGSWCTDPSVLFDIAVVTNTYGSSNSAHRGFVWWKGRLTTNAAGNLKISWKHYDNGFAGGSVHTTLYAGSFMYATPLNVCGY